MIEALLICGLALVCVRIFDPPVSFDIQFDIQPVRRKMTSLKEEEDLKNVASSSTLGKPSSSPANLLLL